VFDNNYNVENNTLLQSEETGEKMGIATFRMIFDDFNTSKVIDNFEVKGNVIDLVNRERRGNNIYL
jgi:hypothetical protein